MATKFHIARVRTERYWQLTLHGVFDGTSAWELRRVMTRLGREHPVIIDFADVTEMAEFGVATLAAGFLARRMPPVQFIGLRSAHRDLMRQYGLEQDLPISIYPAPHPVLGNIDPVASR